MSSPTGNSPARPFIPRLNLENLENLDAPKSPKGKERETKEVQNNSGGTQAYTEGKSNLSFGPSLLGFGPPLDLPPDPSDLPVWSPRLRALSSVRVPDDPDVNALWKHFTFHDPVNLTADEIKLISKNTTAFITQLQKLTEEEISQLPPEAKAEAASVWRVFEAIAAGGLSAYATSFELAKVLQNVCNIFDPTGTTGAAVFILVAGVAHAGITEGTAGGIMTNYGARRSPDGVAAADYFSAKSRFATAWVKGDGKQMNICADLMEDIVAKIQERIKKDPDIPYAAKDPIVGAVLRHWASNLGFYAFSVNYTVTGGLLPLWRKLYGGESYGAKATVQFIELATSIVAGHIAGATTAGIANVLRREIEHAPPGPQGANSKPIYKAKLARIDAEVKMWEAKLDKLFEMNSMLQDRIHHEGGFSETPGLQSCMDQLNNAINGINKKIIKLKDDRKELKSVFGRNAQTIGTNLALQFAPDKRRRTIAKIISKPLSLLPYAVFVVGVTAFVNSRMPYENPPGSEEPQGIPPAVIGATASLGWFMISSFLLSVPLNLYLDAALGYVVGLGELAANGFRRGDTSGWRKPRPETEKQEDEPSTPKGEQIIPPVDISEEDHRQPPGIPLLLSTTFGGQPVIQDNGLPKPDTEPRDYDSEGDEYSDPLGNWEDSEGSIDPRILRRMADLDASLEAVKGRRNEPSEEQDPSDLDEVIVDPDVDREVEEFFEGLEQGKFKPPPPREEMDRLERDFEEGELKGRVKPDPSKVPSPVPDAGLSPQESPASPRQLPISPRQGHPSIQSLEQLERGLSNLESDEKFEKFLVAMDAFIKKPESNNT